MRFRAGVHDPAEDERREGDGPVGQVADGVGQVVAIAAVRDHGAAPLMHQYHGSGLLGGLPKGKELGHVEGLAVHVIADHGALQAHAHSPFQLGYGGGYVLHGEGGEAGEAARVVNHQLGHVVVAFPGHFGCRSRVFVVVVEKGVGGKDLNVHTEGVHVNQPLFRGPRGPGIIGLIAGFGGRHAVPGFAVAERLYEGGGRDMGVDVDSAHRGFPSG